MLETLISFVLATATLAVAPGPDNIFVLTQGIVNGSKYGLATVAGLMTGCIIHTSLVAFGVSEALKHNEFVFFGIKLFGAGYLLYLAFLVYKSDPTIAFSTEGVKKQSLWKLFKRGFWMNVLNPKVTVFFLAFFPKFLFSEELAVVWQFYVLGGLFIVTSFTIFSSIALLAGSIANYIRRHQVVGIYLKWVQIVVFTGIAIAILV